MVKTANNKRPVLIKDPNFQQIDFCILIGLVLSIGLIPIILRMKVINFIAPKLINTVLNSGVQTDIFSYYKWVFLILSAITLIVFLLVKIVKYRYEIRQSYINIPLLFLILMVIVSVIFSSYKAIALYGTYDRWEATISMICYLLLFFVAANIKINKGFIKYINYALILVVGVNLVLTLLKFFDINISSSKIVLALLIPPSMHDATTIGSFGSTFGNPNYASGLFGAISVYFLFLDLPSVDMKNRVMCILLSLASFIIVLISKSSSGFVAMLLIIILFAILLFIIIPDKINLLKKYSIAAICLSLVFALMCHIDPAIYKNTIGTTSNLFSYTLGSSSNGVDTETRENIAKTDVKTSNDISNGRFFVWERTLDMIWDKPFLGHGAGTLAYYFPQNSPDKLKYFHDNKIYVDKPHSFYIDVAFGFGIIALLSLLCLFMFHLYNSFIIMKKPIDNLISWRLALLAFFCAYLIQWIFNDSTIGSSIIFWVLFGLAVSLNHTDTATN